MNNVKMKEHNIALLSNPNLWIVHKFAKKSIGLVLRTYTGIGICVTYKLGRQKKNKKSQLDAVTKTMLPTLHCDSN